MRVLIAVALSSVLVAFACTGQQGTPETPALPSATASPVSATPGSFGASSTPPANIEEVLRAHLAVRLSIDPSVVTVVSIEPARWPDACLGISRPGRVCAQAITAGWLAILRTPDGTEYRYHGAAARFEPAP